MAHIFVTNKTLPTRVIQMAHAHGGQAAKACITLAPVAHVAEQRMHTLAVGWDFIDCVPPGAARHKNQLLRAQSMPACRLDARASARGPRTVHMKTHRRQHVHSLASCWRCALAADAGCGGFRCECRRAQRTSMTTLHASGSGCASPRHASI